MKINTDVFAVNGTKRELNSQRQRSTAKNTDKNLILLS